MRSPFTIEVKSDYQEFFRYNTIVTCGGYDNAGKLIYVESAEIIYSEQINTDILATPIAPVDFKIGRPLLLECRAATNIQAIIYVITNTLPEDRIVDNLPPFALQITITEGTEVIYDTSHEVNQWGGATITINL